MTQTIWDFKRGDRFKLLEGGPCEVMTPTEDGKGLVAKYLDGDIAGKEDFAFEEEIDFSELPTS